MVAGSVLLAWTILNIRRAPHVHFQLSIEPPETHDMPGAVALADRNKALVQYPDPRWVLGEIY
jgi:hypothetical protein